MSKYRRGLEVGRARARGRGRPPIRIGQKPTTKLPIPRFKTTTNFIEANGESQKAFSKLRGWTRAADVMTPNQLERWQQLPNEVIPKTTNDDIARLFVLWNTAVATMGKPEFLKWWRRWVWLIGTEAQERSWTKPNEVFDRNAQMWNGFARAASEMRGDVVETLDPSYWREFRKMLGLRGEQIYGAGAAAGRALKKAAGTGLLFIALGLAAVVVVPLVISKAAESRD